MKMKIAVIGAGTAGLSAAKNALSSSNNEVTVFEQTNNVGGTWVYTDKIGVDDYGLEVHTSMYRGLKTNLPKEIMGYPDFPIPEQKNSYIKAEEMLSFLNSYADHFDIKKHVKFLHYVIRIKPKGESQWELIARDLSNDIVKTYIFDAVMICNGHYNTPFIPQMPGKQIFKGQQLHSHDYRHPDPFVNETVLVIGAGPSGMDLAYEISKKAKRVTLSHHLKEKPKTEFPQNVTQRGDVVRMTENGAIFNDGTEENFTVIFYCTGYRYTFPFLSVDCGITVEENFVSPLYKHVMNINRPTMCFIGLPFYVCASQMFDLQSRFFLSFMVGHKELPSKQEMIQDTKREMEIRWENGLKKHQSHLMGPNQNKYYADLSKTADILPLKPVITKLHNDSCERFNDDLINFRKDIYKIIDDETFIKIVQ